MKKPVFKGSAVALITPYTKDGSAVDFDAYGTLIDRQIAGGTAALVVCATTGEAPTLSDSEHHACINFAVARAAGRIPVIAGAGSNDTAHAVEMSRYAMRAGADAVLLVTPYYNKTNQSGLIRHFLTVADAVELPLILYNVPSRTGMTIKPETYAALSPHPNINGVKEASGDFTLISHVLCQCDGLWVWSGNDDNTLPMMALGAVGVISVASNIVPAVVARLCHLCLTGDFKAARLLNQQYFELFHALFMDVNPIPVKAAMELAGMEPGLPRLPLGQLSHQDAQKLVTVMQSYGLLEKAV